VFVTVGSTKFPELVEAVLSPEVIDTLCALGFVELCVQHGKDGELFRERSKTQTRLAMRGFDYSPSIDGEMSTADLIISHAGKGSCGSY
jgi:beta-1,4-N-acetylglucosaminyltransferase